MTFLSEFLRTIIIMSLSGGLVVMLLLLIKPIVRHRLPKSAQYYLWLVALFALLIPLSRIFTLPQAVSEIAPIYSAVERGFVSVAEERARFTTGTTGEINPEIRHNMQANIAGTTLAPLEVTLVRTGTYASAETSAQPGILAHAVTIFILVYPWGLAAVLLYNIAGYIRFKRKLQKSFLPANEFEVSLLSKLSEKRVPALFMSSVAATPMLVGMLKPTIILPNRQYTNEQLRVILLHELTHLRRHDVAVKWLSLASCAVHWFNPLAWLLRREIDSICELSCDEAVIRNMGKNEKQNYGNTLISVASDYVNSETKISIAVLSTTMCEEKRALKERLGAIMKSRKHTKFAFLVSVFVILAVVLAACVAGAGRSETNETAPDAYAYRNLLETQGEIENQLEAESTIRTHEDYANDYINYMAQIQNVGVFEEPDGEFHIRQANIIDTSINRFEKLAEFDHILPYPIELWRLEFMLQTDDLETETLRWGTFAPDEYGWIGQHTGWNDANILLAFSRNADELEFLGNIPRWMELHVNTETTEGKETVLRQHLEEQGILQVTESSIPFPTGLSPVFPHDLLGEGGMELRASIISEIGGLAFNEAYHFRMEDGNYALITGWRPFESVAEMQRYIPQLNLPETVGDFTLRRIYVDNGGIFDGIRVNNEPVWPWLRGINIYRDAEEYSRETAHDPVFPLNDVFIMYNWLDYMPVFTFFALYENSAGQLAGVSAYNPIFPGTAESWHEMTGSPFTIAERTETETLILMGQGNEYYLAVLDYYDNRSYDFSSLTVFLSFRNSHTPPISSDRRVSIFSATSASPVERAALEELVQIFNPAEMIERYGWSAALDSLQ